MPAFVYRCPNTRFLVQGYSPERASDNDATDEAAYETVTCIVCKQVHLVNPAIGKVLGQAAD